MNIIFSIILGCSLGSIIAIPLCWYLNNVLGLNEESEDENLIHLVEQQVELQGEIIESYRNQVETYEQLVELLERRLRLRKTRIELLKELYDEQNSA